MQTSEGHVQFWDVRADDRPWGTLLDGLDAEISAEDDRIVSIGKHAYYRQCDLCREELRDMQAERADASTSDTGG